MSLYLDTSCLLKLLFPEPETRRTLQMVAAEQEVIVSSLARLEAMTQIHARAAGGLLTRPAARTLIERLGTVLAEAPYEIVPTSGSVVDLAEMQLRALPKQGYCPTLDRLHLAAMQALELRRILTNDDAQAHAARALGFTVLMPR